MDYSQTSFYYKTPQITKNGVSYLDLYQPVDLQRSSSDRQIVLPPKYEYRPFLLSYDLYGTDQYFYVFMLRNPNIIKDPIWDFKTGITIYIPNSITS